jgi:hypothetical protein
MLLEHQQLSERRPAIVLPKRRSGLVVFEHENLGP